MQECKKWRGEAPRLFLPKPTQFASTYVSDKRVHSVLAQLHQGIGSKCGLHRDYNNNLMKSGMVGYTLVYFPHDVGESDGK